MEGGGWRVGTHQLVTLIVNKKLLLCGWQEKKMGKWAEPLGQGAEPQEQLLGGAGCLLSTCTHTHTRTHTNTHTLTNTHTDTHAHTNIFCEYVHLQ